MRDIKVSIITVCLNSAETIEQTIQSVLGQTWKNIEYIIIDGQSTDGTLEIIAKYGNQIAKCISEKDNGLYDAMNKGIDMAEGDVIGIINSDDWYAENAVEKAVEAFQKEDVGVVYGIMEIVHPSGHTSIFKNDVLENMLYRMVIPHPTVFVRKRVYQEIGVFDLRWKVLADYDWLLRMYLNGTRIQQVPYVLTYFRKGGFSAINKIQCTNEMRDIARYYAKKRQDSKTLEQIEQYHQTRIKRMQSQEMRDWILKNDRAAAAVILKKWLNGKVNIFGAGSVGTEYFLFFREMDITVECFLDNDETKYHTEFLGKPVKKCCKKEKNDNYIVVAAASYPEEITRQLESMGYQKDIDFGLYYDIVERLFHQVKSISSAEKVCI